MRLTLEDPVNIIIGLDHCLLDELPVKPEKLLDLPGGQVIKKRERGVDDQDGCQDIVNSHCIVQAKNSKTPGVVNLQARDHQD